MHVHVSYVGDVFSLVASHLPDCGVPGLLASSEFCSRRLGLGLRLALRVGLGLPRSHQTTAKSAFVILKLSELPNFFPDFPQKKAVYKHPIEKHTPSPFLSFHSALVVALQHLRAANIGDTSVVPYRYR